MNRDDRTRKEPPLTDEEIRWFRALRREMARHGNGHLWFLKQACEQEATGKPWNKPE